MLNVYVGPAPQMNQDCAVKTLHCLDKLLIAAIRRYMMNKEENRGREGRFFLTIMVEYQIEELDTIPPPSVELARDSEPVG